MTTPTATERTLRNLLNWPDEKPLPFTKKPAKAEADETRSVDQDSPASTNPVGVPNALPWSQLSDSDGPRRWQKVLRYVALAVLVLFALIGVRTAFTPRAVVPAPVLPAAATFPQAAAGGAAARFAAIYGTWYQDSAESRATALAGVWGGDPRAGWNGRGWQNVTGAVPVAVIVESATTARVTVMMNVTSWTKDNAGKQRDVVKQPMALQVPIIVGDDGIARVSGVPVWVAPPSVTPLTIANPGDASSDLTSETSRAATAFFTSYGRDTDLSSLTAPGSTLTGLGGALTLSAVRQWAVVANSGDTATATAQVTWASANGATIDQTYRVELRRTSSGAASRWQVLTLTTTL